MLNMSVELGLTFLFSLTFLFLARKVAKKVGLVDKPNFRKRHQGTVPLVGGISVFAGVCFAFLITNYYQPNDMLYLSCAGVLVLVGVIDDKFDISVKIRAAVQAGAEAVGRAEVIDGGSRRAAIRKALAVASPSDVVAILGKGHEVGQEINGEVHPFADAAVVAEEWVRSE